MKVAHALAAAVLLLAASAARAEDSSEKAAVAAAAAWLKLVDAGSYGPSWDEAAAFFKSAIGRADWEKALKSARSPLGKLVSRKVASRTYTESVPGAPDGKYVVLQYETSFEKKKRAIETVTPMLDADGRWRVSGYFIK
jgi:opacity protein-like surface antigen